MLGRELGIEGHAVRHGVREGGGVHAANVEDVHGTAVRPEDAGVAATAAQGLPYVLEHGSVRSVDFGDVVGREGPLFPLGALLFLGGVRVGGVVRRKESRFFSPFGRFGWRGWFERGEESGSFVLLDVRREGKLLPEGVSIAGDGGPEENIEVSVHAEFFAKVLVVAVVEGEREFLGDAHVLHAVLEAGLHDVVGLAGMLVAPELLLLVDDGGILPVAGDREAVFVPFEGAEGDVFVDGFVGALTLGELEGVGAGGLGEFGAAGELERVAHHKSDEDGSGVGVGDDALGPAMEPRGVFFLKVGIG